MEMRCLRSVLVVVLGALLAACDPGGEGEAPVKTFKPDGRVTFINYWAEWCHPCREEIPVLNRFNEKYRETARVLGVNFDGLTGAELLAVEQRMDVAFPTLAEDPGPALGVPRPTGLPVTLVVDGSGEVVARLEGEQTMASLESALGEVTASGEEQ